MSTSDQNWFKNFESVKDFNTMDTWKFADVSKTSATEFYTILTEQELTPALFAELDAQSINELVKTVSVGIRAKIARLIRFIRERNYNYSEEEVDISNSTPSITPIRSRAARLAKNPGYVRRRTMVPQLPSTEHTQPVSVDAESEPRSPKGKGPAEAGSSSESTGNGRTTTNLSTSALNSDTSSSYARELSTINTFHKNRFVLPLPDAKNFKSVSKFIEAFTIFVKRECVSANEVYATLIRCIRDSDIDILEPHKMQLINKDWSEITEDIHQLLEPTKDRSVYYSEFFKMTFNYREPISSCHSRFNYKMRLLGYTGTEDHVIDMFLQKIDEETAEKLRMVMFDKTTCTVTPFTSVQHVQVAVTSLYRDINAIPYFGRQKNT